MNYKKIYSRAIEEILAGNPLRMYLGEDERDSVMLTSYCLCFLPKDKNIFALKESELPKNWATRLLPKGETVELCRANMVTDTLPKARLLRTVDGEEYPWAIDDALLKLFDKTAAIKISPGAKTPVFYIYEHNELVGMIAPIHRLK